MNIHEILEYWAKHVDYDPNQKSFNLLSSNYEFNRCGRTMKMIMEEYDPSGLLAVMYAKLRYREILDHCSVNLWSLIENPGELEPYIKMRDMFNSPEISRAEDDLIAGFNAKLSLIEGCPLIGEEEKQDSLKRIYEAIGDVCETLNECHIEVYFKGTGDFTVDKISSYIHVFDTLAETLIALETAPEMAYICYIRQYQSSGGYFGIFIKSNGTILSVNDRVNETYIGQHQNSRNGRWQEDKKFELFPYDKIVEDINGKDYKGYAVNYIVSDKNVLLKDVGAENYTRLILAILLLSYKLNRFDIRNAELTYTNALLTNSTLLTGNTDCKELIVVSNSLIASGHKQLSFTFTDEDILSGVVNKRYDRKTNPDNREAGWYSNRNQLLVDLYGKGFHADLTRTAKYERPLLTDGDCKPIISEFVGSEYKMEAQAYRDIREQLAEYIKAQMQKELDDFGGPKAVDEWFENLLRTKRDVIIRKAAELYRDIIVAKTRQNHMFDAFTISASSDYQVSVVSGAECKVSRAQVVNYAVDVDTNQYPKKYLCPITGNTANVWIIVSPQTAENIKHLFELDTLPKIVQGWVLTDSILGYDGNSILDNVDPVSEVQHILSHSYGNYKNSKDFYFAVGFSKRGIKKLLKELDLEA